MNRTVDENSEMFMDISSIKNEKIPKIKGLCEYLVNFIMN